MTPAEELQIREQLDQAIESKNALAELEAREALDAVDKPFINTALDVIQGVGEAQEVGQTLISGAVAVPTSGLAGIATMSPLLDALDMGVEDKSGVVEGIQDAMIIPPKTPGAQAKLQTLQDLLNTGIEAVRVPLSKMGEAFELMSGRTPEEAAQVAQDINEKGFSQTYADSVFEKTGDPLIAALAFAAPQIIPELIGNRILNRAPTDLELRVADEIRGQEIEVPGQIEPIEPVEGIGRKILDGAGDAVDNVAFDQAVKQGWDPKYIAMMQGSPRVDKDKVLRMLKIVRNNRADPRTAIRNIHSNVLGESVLQRFAANKQLNTEARIRLDSVANDLKGQPVDILGPARQFSDTLNELGVEVVRGVDGQPIRNKNGSLKFDYTDSDLTPSSRVPIERVINKMDRLTQKGADAHSAHLLKRFIDEHVEFGKSSEGGIARSAENALKDFRRGIDESLDNTFPEYNEVNTIIHDTIKAMGTFQEQAGKKLDLSKPSAKKTVGILMRRPTSNAKSGGPVMDAVDLLEETARKNDIVFDDSLEAQMLMVQEIERMFPRIGGTTFKGEITKGVTEFARQSPTERVVGAAGKVAEIARGINEDNQLKALEKLLRE